MPTKLKNSAASLTRIFLEQIIRHMDEQGISQAELARRLGCSKANVSKLLRGKSNITAATMEKLAKALDVEVGLAVHGNGGQPEIETGAAAPEREEVVNQASKQPKTRGRKKGPLYDYSAHLRHMADLIVASGMTLSERKAAETASHWAKKQGYVSVSAQTLRTHFAKVRQKQIETARLRQDQIVEEKRRDSKPARTRGSSSAGGSHRPPSSGADRIPMGSWDWELPRVDTGLMPRWIKDYNRRLLEPIETGPAGNSLRTSFNAAKPILNPLREMIDRDNSIRRNGGDFQ